MPGTFKTQLTPALAAFRVILGSESASRRQLLSEMGVQYESCAAKVDERSIGDRSTEPPGRIVEKIARAKAEARIISCVQLLLPVVTSIRQCCWSAKAGCGKQGSVLKDPGCMQALLLGSVRSIPNGLLITCDQVVSRAPA
jgi:hypothetical protein